MRSGARACTDDTPRHPGRPRRIRKRPWSTVYVRESYRAVGARGAVSRYLVAAPESESKCCDSFSARSHSSIRIRPRPLDLDHCMKGPSQNWPSNSASCATPSTVTSIVASSTSRAELRPSLNPPPNAMSGAKSIWIDRKRSMPITDSLRRRSARQNRVKLAREEGPTTMTSPLRPARHLSSLQSRLRVGY